DHAHNCFIVNDAPRTKFAKEVNGGVDWGLGVWHKVRIERKASSDTVRVYFDDMAKPIMIAEEKTFGQGAIGFGSFDDTGKITNIRVWSNSAETKETPAFKYHRPGSMAERKQRASSRKQKAEVPPANRLFKNELQRPFKDKKAW